MCSSTGHHIKTPVRQVQSLQSKSAAGFHHPRSRRSNHLKFSSEQMLEHSMLTDYRSFHLSPAAGRFSVDVLHGLSCEVLSSVTCDLEATFMMKEYKTSPNVRGVLCRHDKTQSRGQIASVQTIAPCTSGRLLPIPARN